MTAALAINDEGVVDLTALDHVAGKLQRVDKPEAGVRQIEVETPTRQLQRVVHSDGRRRFEPVPTNRCVDQQAYVVDPDTTGGNGLRSSSRGGVGEQVALGPPASFFDPGQTLEKTRLGSNALVGLGQYLVKVG